METGGEIKPYASEALLTYKELLTCLLLFARRGPELIVVFFMVHEN